MNSRLSVVALEARLNGRAFVMLYRRPLGMPVCEPFWLRSLDLGRYENAMPFFRVDIRG